MSFKKRLRFNPLSVVIGVASVSTLPCFAAQNKFDAVLEEVEIQVSTGTKLPRLPESSAASVFTADTWQLLQEGVHQPVDLLTTKTFFSGSHIGADGINEISLSGVNLANIAGLGETSTLVLLNGQRQTLSAATTAGGNQGVDLNSLAPMIAVERVEIMRSGASSIYGSDAVAGVMNFITYKDFVGKQLSADLLDGGDGQQDRTISGMWGNRFDNISVLTAFSYLDRDPVSAADVRDEYELRNSSSNFGQPGTYLVSGTRVPDPACTNVVQTDTGPFCVFDFGDSFTLVSEEKRMNIYGEIRMDLAGGGKVFLEGGYIKNEINSTTSPTQPILFPQVVPVDNPGNFAGVPMVQFGRVQGEGSEPSVIDAESVTYRLVSGMSVPISDIWSFNATLSYSVNEYDYADPSDTAVDRYIDALNGRGGPNGDLYYNPLFGADNDPAVLDYIRGVYGYDAESSLAVLDVYTTAQLFSLPAGKVEVVFGAQFQRNELTYHYTEDARNDNLFFFIGNRDFSSSKDVQAVFLETHVPLHEKFNVEGALRYEDQEGFESVDPKVGLVWNASDSMRLYSTYSTSFRAPSPFQDAGQITTPERVRDVVFGNNLVTVSQRTVSDPDDPLTAEESTNFNIGLEWHLSNYGLRGKLEYYNFDYSDIITPENANAVVSVDPFGDRVTRDPNTDALLAVTTFFRNAGGLKTDGVDLSVAYTLTNALTLKSDTTYVLSYDLDDPVLGEIDGLGNRNFTNFASPMPELRSNFGIYWQGEYNSANLVVRHVGSYENDENNNDRIDSYTTLDALWRMDIPTLFGYQDAFTVSLGAKNLTDDYAPDIVSRNGFDTRTASGLGRQVFGSITFTF